MITTFRPDPLQERKYRMRAALETNPKFARELREIADSCSLEVLRREFKKTTGRELPGLRSRSNAMMR
jgi:hypothetical protein